ncbi:glycosyltransferase family 4 protein [Cognatishimia sp. F0-27]|uniref:glycosyltransferase family 4 protein n=1 Tax=Cognatishimia sp. F0-27 TaxID=2816855 RepID=UPI001D0CB043|nr:glycosyltransferase family 4 protein [Cognatishimia sp. F0-27]MCC1491374.1 glycosyltransferase family 4 protein [Cognatishimia sp. F0-27]
MTRLRIAYLCDHSPLDRNLYSGGNARIHDALCAHAGDVTILDNRWHGVQPVRRLIEALPVGANLRLRWRMHLMLARRIARGVETELARGGYDVLFGAYSLHSMAQVRVPAGCIKVFTSDATQTVYRTSEIGASFKRKLALSALMDTWVERQEKAILHSLDLALWPSQWLLDAVTDRYDLPPKAARLIEWGANIDPVPAPAPRRIAPDAPLRLLLIGRDWFAKGGPVAFDTMQALRAQGVDARLCVIGCMPPAFHTNEWVTIHPQLDKAIPDQLAQFNAALAGAHFLVQPSFESYGFAFCEASAHGLPSLCLRVGGVPVRDGINGHALPPGSPPDAFAARIRTYLDDPSGYAALCASARREYEERLNWDAWGRRTAQALHEVRAAQRLDR